MNTLKTTGIWLLLLAFSGCEQSDLKQSTLVLNLPSSPYGYAGVHANSYIPTLGRVLFYDARLSLNNSVSCSSCHKQAMAFADNVRFSPGFENKPTFRNSMPIQNLTSGFVFGGIGSFDTLSLFWDGREKLLSAMVLRPITNHVEMGIDDLGELSDKLSKFPEYQNLFTSAFGTPEVTEFKIATALSEFLSSIQSSDTKLDKFLQGQGELSAIEQTGQALFFGKYDCNSCHQTGFQNGYQLGGGFVNIGLDENYIDPGHADVTGSPADRGKFKIPTLRNVALTAPYMHDGRFATFDDVLEHYSHDIQDSPALDQRLRGTDGKPLEMNISDEDKEAIIAFLYTMTDYNMITDPKFSNPFQVQ